MSEINRDINLLVGPLKIIIPEINADITKHNFPFAFFEGWRSPERQKELVAQGNSKTLDSPHLKGCAVDYVLLFNTWSWDYKNFSYWWESFGKFVSLKYDLEWGGNWTTFKDYPHFQLKNWRNLNG